MLILCSRLVSGYVTYYFWLSWYFAGKQKVIRLVTTH